MLSNQRKVVAMDEPTPVFELSVTGTRGNYFVMLSFGGVAWPVEGPIRSKQCAESIFKHLSKLCQCSGGNPAFTEIGAQLARVLKWRRVNTDLPDFPWETWRAAFEKQVSDLVASGERPIQVDTRPDDFAAWLIANKRDVGSSARADYAMFRTMQLVKNGDI